MTAAETVALTKKAVPGILATEWAHRGYGVVVYPDGHAPMEGSMLYKARRLKGQFPVMRAELTKENVASADAMTRALIASCIDLTFVGVGWTAELEDVQTDVNYAEPEEAREALLDILLSEEGVA